MWIVALDIKGIEETHQALDVLVLLEEFLEDGTVDHMIDDSNVEVLSV
jgi:hypothetical protein